MTKKLTISALLVALAMIFSYVEVLIPFNFGIPGIKLGLANLVVVVALYLLDARQALIISVVRICLSPSPSAIWLHCSTVSPAVF